MNQKINSLFLPLFCIFLNSIANSQTTNDSIHSSKIQSYINAKSILGFWHQADSTKNEIEFVDEKYQVTLKSIDKSLLFYFPEDSTGQIYASGYFPMWPPPSCFLELISEDSMKVTISPFFDPGKPELFIRKNRIHLKE